MTGEKIRGGTLTTNEQTECLAELNSMLDSWSNENLMIHQLSQTSFALTASQGSYTIGSGGDFNMTRPTKLVEPCFIRDGDGFDSPLKIIDMVTYGRFGLKSTDGSYPEYIAYNYGYSATSTGTVFFYPEPQAGLSTFINTLQPLLNFSTLTHNAMFPPGYQLAIESNYAIHSAAGLIEVSPELARIARESKAAIKGTNLRTPISRLDYAITGGVRSNILSGP